MAEKVKKIKKNLESAVCIAIQNLNSTNGSSFKSISSFLKSNNEPGEDIPNKDIKLALKLGLKSGKVVFRSGRYFNAEAATDGCGRRARRCGQSRRRRSKGKSKGRRSLCKSRKRKSRGRSRCRKGGRRRGCTRMWKPKRKRSRRSSRSRRRGHKRRSSSRRRTHKRRSSRKRSVSRKRRGCAKSCTKVWTPRKKGRKCKEEKSPKEEGAAKHPKVKTETDE